MQKLRIQKQTDIKKRKIVNCLASGKIIFMNKLFYSKKKLLIFVTMSGNTIFSLKKNGNNFHSAFHMTISPTIS